MFFFLACAVPPAPVAERGPIVSAQRVHGETTDDGGRVGFDVLVTDETGAPLPCDEGDLTVTVAVSTDPGGPWTTVDDAQVATRCREAGGGDVALVVDNSGSEDGYLDQLRDAATAMADGVVGAGGRVSLVRVSTESAVQVALTDDATAVDSALDGLHVDGGWTSLWDGVRMGHETLGAGAVESASLDDFCGETAGLGVVTFTDGQDNNSADEQDYDHDRYPGDGIATTTADLGQLHTGGAVVPDFTVGLGREVDGDALRGVADASGGRYTALDSSDEIADAFSLISDSFSAGTQVCAALPDSECGLLYVRVTTSWVNGSDTIEQTRTVPVSLDCEDTPVGNVATLLLTLSDPGIPEATAATLAADAVAFTAPAPGPNVLVVLDDNNHGEDADDAAYIADLLTDAGYAVTYTEEPADGFAAADFDDYDVVWFSNPGYPFDDRTTYDALRTFSASGGGVVLQGDDISWSWAMDFTLDALTHLDFVDNGVTTCGAWTDDDVGSWLRVSVDDTDHPLVAGLAGTSFLYGNDIDATVPRDEGETVLAWSTLDGDDACAPVPVIVGWQP